jgi:hypothetical protein
MRKSGKAISRLGPLRIQALTADRPVLEREIHQYALTGVDRI